MSTPIQIDFLLSQVRTAVGDAIVGGKAYFYAAGTTTPADVYLNATGTIKAANPYTLDANGTALLYGNGVYRVVIKDANGVMVCDRDYLTYMMPDAGDGGGGGGGTFYISDSGGTESLLVSDEVIVGLSRPFDTAGTELALGFEWAGSIPVDQSGTGKTAIVNFGSAPSLVRSVSSAKSQYVSAGSSVSGAQFPNSQFSSCWTGGNWTIDCWAWMGATQVPGGYLWIAAVPTYPVSGSLMGLAVTDQGKPVRLWYDAQTPRYLVLGQAVSSIQDGAWHHVELSRQASGSTWRLYVDGVLQTQVSGEPYDWDSYGGAESVSIASPANGASPADTWIDCLRIYPYVRHTTNFTP